MEQVDGRRGDADHARADPAANHDLPALSGVHTVTQAEARRSMPPPSTKEARASHKPYWAAQFKTFWMPAAPAKSE